MQTFSQIYSIMIIKSGNLLGFNKKIRTVKSDKYRN